MTCLRHAFRDYTQPAISGCRSADRASSHEDLPFLSCSCFSLLGLSGLNRASGSRALFASDKKAKGSSWDLVIPKDRNILSDLIQFWKLTEKFSVVSV